MLKEASHKEKFAMLTQWMPAIVDSIKKDLKNEHLKKDAVFVRHYFSGKNPAKLTNEELATAYTHAIMEGDQGSELAEFITSRWLLKHSDLYHYFEQELSQINPNFTELETLDQEISLAMVDQSVQQFGALNTYLFCVLNSVVFPENVYASLKKLAVDKCHQAESESLALREKTSAESVHKNYELQIARLTDRYEKKLSGLQKKYITDVDSLKKQIANLQRKLNV